MSEPTRISRRKATRHPGRRLEAFSEFCTFADLKDLTPVQRIAWLAFDYASAVENNDHYQYFLERRELDPAEVISALRTVGAAEQADILTAAHRALVDAAERGPQNGDMYLTGVDRADFTEFDDAFARCPRPVFACLAEYLDRHESDFIEWTP